MVFTSLLLFTSVALGDLSTAFDGATVWATSANYVRTVGDETWIVRGDAVWERAEGGQRLFVEGRLVDPYGQETQLSVLREGKLMLALDRTRRRWAHLGADSGPTEGATPPGGTGPMKLDESIRLLTMLAPLEFDPSPGTGCVETQAEMRFGGESCQVLGCKRDGANYVWYVSCETGLPRFVERTTEPEDGPPVVERLTLIGARPLEKDELFPTLAAPEGFKELEPSGDAGAK